MTFRDKVEALREKALKARPGPWGLEPESDGTEMVAYSANPWRIRSVIFRNFERRDPNWIANMDLISAASPDFIIELCNRILAEGRE